jgi:hypothetical protein
MLTKWVSDNGMTQPLVADEKDALQMPNKSSRTSEKGKPPVCKRITCYEMLDKALDMDRALGTTYTTENRYRIWHLDSEERLKVRGTDGSCQKTGEVWVRLSRNTESQRGHVCHQTTRGFYFFQIG